MPQTPLAPFSRNGIRFTSDPTHDLDYFQALHDEGGPDSPYRGELFLNEPLREIYFVPSTGVAEKFVSLTNLREFANDTEAAAAIPPVSVGGFYRTESVVKIRVV